jgi:hypothetical protein
LGVEQKRERLGGGEPVDGGGVFLRGLDIAGADRDKPVGNRLIGAHAAATLPTPGQ